MGSKADSEWSESQMRDVMQYSPKYAEARDIAEKLCNWSAYFYEEEVEDFIPIANPRSGSRPLAQSILAIEDFGNQRALEELERFYTHYKVYQDADTYYLKRREELAQPSQHTSKGEQ